MAAKRISVKTMKTAAEYGYGYTSVYRHALGRER